MNLITKRLTFLVGLTLCAILSGYSQVVTSTRNGLWTDPTVWDLGFIPTAENASEIVVNHEVTIPESNNLSIRNVIVNNSLTVESGSVVDLIEDGVPATWDLQVFGTLTLHDSATLNGTSVSNTSFESGSRYVHLQGPLGFIPYATWDSNSTFEIAGFRTQGYINIAHSDSWKQSFGHVVYNCTQQTTAFVDLNGYLRNIAGDLVILSTNNQSLRLSTTQSPVIAIGGDLIIDGPSKVWFSTTPGNAVINIQGDFRYRSGSPGISYFTTRGVVSVNVFGEMEMNSPGRIHMATTSADSTGTRQSTLSLYGDLTLNNGVMIAPPAPGEGMINFMGTGVQSVVTSSTGSSFQGNLDFTIESSATVNLGNSVLANSSGSLSVRGALQVGSSDPGGAIQLGNAGNIRVQGDRIFENGATVEYNGVAEQWIGVGHPSAPGLNVICNNASGVTLLNAIVVMDFTVAETTITQSYPVSVYGNLTVDEDVSFNPEQIHMLGSQVQEISSPGSTFGNLLVNKSGGTVNLTSPLTIGESLVIESTSTTFNTNGNLLLRSISDEMTGMASVGPLPSGSSVTGEVTVQRFMSGEGRIYRYISSPVQNGTIASLKDDFPVTGKFQDPSTGSGIQSASPSFYYYDESIGALDAGWLPYPTSGLASGNPLEVGRGYAAFIRRATSSTTWDVTGLLNQGTIELPVAFTPNNEPSNGWNLVGNPYACAIQWDNDAEAAWTRQNISSVIAIRDNGTGGGTFRYWDMDDGDSEIAGGRVATGQSFWVRATGENPVLTIHEGAKVLGGAEFFRQEKSPVPSFAISLSRGNLMDIAYYKIRPQSKPGLDDWDGIKLENDNFDLSFISADQQSMAILATDRISCDTVIQLGMKDLTPGVYNLSLKTRSEFSRYEYFVLDRFLGTETIVNPAQPIQLTVTEDAASYAFDRVAIRIVERKPDSENHIQSPEYACTGNVVPLVIKDTEGSLTYTVWDNNETLLSSVRAAADGDLTMNIHTDSLSLGSHTFTITARSVCYNVTLTENRSITIGPVPVVWADSVISCPGRTGVLTAFSDDPNALFTWFAGEQADDSLAVGAFFETPPIVKSTVYYVEAVTPSGCRSQRYPVRISAKDIVDAKISVLNDTTILSNYATNNQWYFDETKLEGATESQLILSLPGVYALEVDTLGCLLRDTYVQIVMQAALESGAVHAYPNPVQEILFIPDPYHRIERVEIVTVQGLLFLRKEGLQREDSDYYEIPVHSLPAGNYFALVTTLGDKAKYVFRFIKK